MQQVNGVERAAIAAASAIPDMESCSDRFALPLELIAKLREPLPPAAYLRTRRSRGYR
jgi:hypothetical protein